MKPIFLFLFLLAVLAGCKQKTSNDWAQWRGPLGDGFSAETNWSHDALDSSKILWSKNIGWGHSAISVQGKRGYVAGWKETINDGDTTAHTTLYCLELLTGKPIWEFSYPAQNRSFPGPRATPVIDRNRIYHLGWEGKLFCLDLNSGKEIWNKNLSSDSLTLIDEWGYNPSPVISGELLLLNLNHHGIALNKNTGEVVWTTNAVAASYASVTLYQFQDKNFGVFISDSTIRLVDVATGSLKAEYKKPGLKAVHNDIMLVDENTFFTSNELLRFTGEKIELIWENDSISSSFRTGFIHEGFAYQFSDYRRKKDLYCVDLKTGTPRWNVDLGQWGAVLGTPGRMIVLTGLGKIMIVETNPDQFKLLEELQALPKQNKQENWCWTMPTLSNGLLLARNSKGDMVCIDLRP